MFHYDRNIRLILFCLLPILGFILGWTLNNRFTDSQKIGLETPKTIAENPESTNLSTFEKAMSGKWELGILEGDIDADSVDLDILWETWRVLQGQYLYRDDMEEQKQVYGAVRGMVASLGDPHTVFLDPEENKEFEVAMQGSFEGIGAELDVRDRQLVIVAPIKGTPADLSGVKAGDVIFKIDDDPTFGMSIEDAVKKIRGPKGESVTLTMLREGEKRPIDITIVRDTIVIKSVEWELKNKTAVITISQFGDRVETEFDSALQAIEVKNVDGFVVDLRRNSGGLLEAVTGVLENFLPDRTIARTKGKKRIGSGNVTTGSNGALAKTPLVVLIDNGSASASEIFAGAIQDYDRGIILGEKSFGKGSVQNFIHLSDGSSLKVTIAEWLTPLGNSIHKTGIEPDIIIVPNKEPLENEEDPLIERAIQIIQNEEIALILEEKKKKAENENEKKSETKSAEKSSEKIENKNE